MKRTPQQSPQGQQLPPKREMEADIACLDAELPEEQRRMDELLARLRTIRMRQAGRRLQRALSAPLSSHHHPH